MQRFSNGRLAKVMVTERQFIGPLHRPLCLALVVCISMILTGRCYAQSDDHRTEAIARSIMLEVRYAGLTTIDSTGQPFTRTMDTLPPDSLFQVWMATNPISRKVRHIRKNPAVSLYFPQSEKGNYVNLTGRASLVDDPSTKSSKWQEDWAQYYPTLDDMILIKIEPVRLEVVSYEHGLISATKDWQAPTIHLKRQP